MNDTTRTVRTAHDTIDAANSAIEYALESLGRAIDELDAAASGDPTDDVRDDDVGRFELVLDALEDMVAQHCGSSEDGVDYDSSALSANAQAMRLLAGYGRLEIVVDHGRRVLAMQRRAGV